MQTTTVSCGQDGEVQVSSGLRNLVVMKTADSAFEGYIKDELTTLKETNDRLFCTALTADWRYSSANGDLNQRRQRDSGSDAEHICEAQEQVRPGD